jgi:hypothetical protein
MPIDTPEQHRRSPRQSLVRLIGAAATASVAVVVLAACGGSSATTSTTAKNSAATTQNTPRSSRFASLRACLQKEGINLPSRPSGGAPGAGGALGLGGGGRFTLPAGVSQSKFMEALKRCGGGNGFPGGRRRTFNSAAARSALTKYAACMREGGVNLPPPNTTGNGPVFNTKGINTSSASFKAAEQKCQSDLSGAFGGRRRPPGTSEGGAPGGAEGAPPAGGSPGGEEPAGA